MVDNINQIRIVLERLVDDLITEGNTAEDAIAEIEGELEALRSSFEADPDPVDDPIDRDEPV
jgi:hypothetical protein